MIHDWICRGSRHHLREAVAVMEANPEVGIVNFAGSRHPANLSRRLKGSNEACNVTPQALRDGLKEHFLDSDQPHLRSRSYGRDGTYREDRDMEQAEIDYTRRWAEQRAFRTAVFPDCKDSGRRPDIWLVF